MTMMNEEELLKSTLKRLFPTILKDNEKQFRP